MSSSTPSRSDSHPAPTDPPPIRCAPESSFDTIYETITGKNAPPLSTTSRTKYSRPFEGSTYRKTVGNSSRSDSSDSEDPEAALASEIPVDHVDNETVPEPEVVGHQAEPKIAAEAVVPENDPFRKQHRTNKGRKCDNCGYPVNTAANEVHRCPDDEEDLFPLDPSSRCAEVRVETHVREASLRKKFKKKIPLDAPPTPAGPPTDEGPSTAPPPRASAQSSPETAGNGQSTTSSSSSDSDSDSCTLSTDSSLDPLVPPSRKHPRRESCSDSDSSVSSSTDSTEDSEAGPSEKPKNKKKQQGPKCDKCKYSVNTAANEVHRCPSPDSDDEEPFPENLSSRSAVLRVRSLAGETSSRRKLKKKIPLDADPTPYRPMSSDDDEPSTAPPPRASAQSSPETAPDTRGNGESTSSSSSSDSAPSASERALLSPSSGSQTGEEAGGNEPTETGVEGSESSDSEDPEAAAQEPTPVNEIPVDHVVNETIPEPAIAREPQSDVPEKQVADSMDE